MADYLSIQQATALLGVSASMLQKRCKDGSLNAVRVGNVFRIERQALEAWLHFVPEPRKVNDSPNADAAQELLATIDRWLAFLKVKDLSPTTIQCYKDRVFSFI